MTSITVDMGDGRIVEFPDEATANKFFASQQGDQPAQDPQGQSFGQSLFENIVGSGAVDTPGERLGQAIGDIAGAGAAGLSRGVTGLADLPADAISGIGSGATSLLEKGANALGINSPDLFNAARDAITAPFSETTTNAVSDLTGGGSQFKGETLPGKIAGTVGEFLPGAALFGGASPSNLLRFGAVPGIASEAAGQATEGTPAEPFARTAAALASPIAVQGLENVARTAISPGGGANPARLAAANLLDREGVKVTAGQATGNEAQLSREAATKAGRKLVDDQGEQFTSAVLRRIGAVSKRASPEVLEAADKRIGSVFGDIGRGVSIPADADLVTKMSQAIGEYRGLASKSTRAPIVGEINKKIVQAFRGDNPLTPKEILTWRSSLSKLTKSSDGATRGVAIDTLEILDDALGAALRAAGRGGDVDRLATARTQWRNLIAIENAITRSGENAATGIITPANLRNALAAQGRKAFAQGKGDLNDLARAGVATMQPLPQSGTQPRLSAREIVTGTGAGTAAGLGSVGLGLDPVTATALGAATIAAPRARNAFLSSPAGQAFMRNQIASPGQQLLDKRLAGTVAGLLAQ